MFIIQRHKIELNHTITINHNQIKEGNCLNSVTEEKLLKFF